MTLNIIDYPTYNKEWVDTLRALAANNVLLVGPACTYTTVSDAITAAVAAGADGSNPWTIFYTDGADPTHDETPGITVLPMSAMQPQMTGPYMRLSGEAKDEMIDTPWDGPLIALVCDDLKKGVWEIPSSDLGAKPDATGNYRPWEYARDKGVPVTLCGSVLYGASNEYPELLDPEYDAGRSILWDLYTGGFPIECHTYNHDHAPTDIDGFILNTLGVREYYRALTSTATEPAKTPHGRIGINPTCWRQSGAWTSGDANLQARERYDGALGQCVRRYFPHSMAYQIDGAKADMFSPIHHGVGTRSFNSTIVSGSDYAGYKAAFELWLASIQHTNNRYVLVFHSFAGGSEPTVTKFKAVVDALAAARLAGTAFPVTLRTLYTAKPAYPQFDAEGRRIFRQRNILPGGDFNGTAANLSTWWVWTFRTGSTIEDGGPTVSDLAHRQRTPSGKCLQMVNATSANEVHRAVRGGRTYLLSMDVKTTAGTDGVKLMVKGHWYSMVGEVRTESASVGLLPATLRAPTADWTTIETLVGVPDWVDLLKIYIYGTADTTHQVCNVALDPI